MRAASTNNSSVASVVEEEFIQEASITNWDDPFYHINAHSATYRGCAQPAPRCGVMGHMVELGNAHTPLPLYLQDGQA
jgi:hypothetical protein